MHARHLNRLCLLNVLALLCDRLGNALLDEGGGHVNVGELCWQQLQPKLLLHLAIVKDLLGRCILATGELVLRKALGQDL